MTKYFTSDLHHSHKNICAYTNRKLETTPEEHNSWLVNIWNNTVKAGDLVYHLGDLSFASKYNQVADFVSALSGQKILLKGNHDKSDFLEQLKNDGLIQAWYDYKEIKLGETKTVLFHFPISSWHQQHRHSFHLHGHSHGSSNHLKGKILDVGLDSAYLLTGKHKFFSEDEIIEYMKNRDTIVNDQHTYREGE